MTIDHFRPKERFKWLLTKYENLYYCCSACNTYKGEQWPSDDEIGAGQRFVDVCQDEWDDHLRIIEGVITGITPPGLFTADALNFDRPTLAERNIASAASVARCRRELQIIEELRASLDPIVDIARWRQLDELEQSAAARLNAILNPAPLTQ